MTDERQPIGGSDRTAAVVRALRELLAAAPDVQQSMGARMGVPAGDVAAIDQVVTAPEPIGPVELARRLGITSASATVMVDRLEARGHLLRQPHEHDRRRISLFASDAARRQVRATLDPLIVAVAQLAAELDDDQAEVVAGFLRDVVRAMRSYAAADDS